MARSDQVMTSFWGDSDYGVFPQLTDEMIRDAEDELGLTLPTSLVRLLRMQNGGVVGDQWNAFPVPVPTSGGDDYVPFDGLMGIGEQGELTSILDTPYLVEEWGLPAPIVLLDGDGHYWIGLDYTDCGRQGEPSVALFDTDEGTSLCLASNFEKFLEGLTAADAV
ncbi:SMI1/KNR4 family protein [Nocardia sp. NPDC052566]|uniref:SMI1/KNR4 family protein n=1 Tax=Nocardia sp. NPDC052566 TaxID=3364330 RepID=UPI0037CA9A5A